MKKFVSSLMKRMCITWRRWRGSNPGVVRLAHRCCINGGKWLRVAGELVNDDNRDVKVAMLEKFPTLKSMYSADDDNTQVLYFKNAVATFSSFTEKPEVIKF